MLVTSAIAGLKAPVATAALGLVWSIGRIVYAKGYVSSTQEQKGSGRLIGAWYMVAQLGLIGTAAWTVFGLVF